MQAGREYGLLYEGQNIHINDGGRQDLPDLAIRDLGDEAGIAALLKENLAKAGLDLLSLYGFKSHIPHFKKIFD